MTMMIDRQAARRGRAERQGPTWAALLCAAATLAVAPGARAQDPAPIDKARMTEGMHAYFHGEKWEGPVFFGAGLAAGGVGALLVTRSDELARGAAYPLFGIGLVQLIVGAVVFLRTDAQVARLDQQLAKDPAAFKKEESARIKGVNTQFIALAIIESVLIAGGTATAIVAAQKDCCRTLQGIGLGLAGQGAVTLALDLFAAARAREYTDNLRRFDTASPAAMSLGQPAPMSFGPISIGVRF
jgi:hypothetical protein